MRIDPGARREWRQFRLLSHDSVRRLIASAVLSRDTDPMQFALWATALAAVPPTTIALWQLGPYSVPLSPAALERLLLGHRMFFVIYAMVTAAILAALMWEALFPDRLDHEVVGPLPVRPRTLAAARLSAALLVAAGFAAAVSVPSGLIFSLISATNPLVGYAPQVFLGHVVATMAACLSVFGGLLVVRGIVAMAFRASVTDRLAIVLQLAAVVSLVQVLVHLSRLLPALVNSLLDGDSLARILPPIWFAALYSWMAGWDRPVLAGLAAKGVWALIVVLAVVIPAYLVPAGLVTRRILELPLHRRGRGGLDVVRRLIAAVMPPPAAAVAGFTLATLARSRRHQLIVVSYLGVGLAIGSVGLLTEAIKGTVAFASPSVLLLSPPLVLMFLLVFGLRAACLPPAHLDANWPFRLSPPSIGHARTAMRLILFWLAVVPVAGLTGAAALMVGWGAAVAGSLAVFNLTAGALLVACAVVTWDRVPFACPHSASPDNVRSQWLLYAVPFAAFSLGIGAMQAASLRSSGAMALYVTTGLGVSAIVHRWSERQMRRDIPFEPPPDSDATTLNLSEALH